MSSTGKTRKRPARRTPLTRELVLRAAMDLADEHGAAELTMRNLAKALGVEAMSLYNHVSSKTDLLDGMIDLVFSEIDAPDPAGDWREELRKRARSTLEALGRHRWAVGQMEGRSSYGPSNLRIHDAVLGCLLGMGLDEATAVHAYSVQDAYIYGFALMQTDMNPETPEEFAASAQRQSVEYETEWADFPHLQRVVGGHVAKVGYDYDAEFAFGFELILDGLARLITEGGRP